MMSIFGALAFHCNIKLEGGALTLPGPLPGGRAKGALCVERPFLTSALMELRVPQVRRVPLCISRVRTTNKCLALCEGLGHPRPPIFTRAIRATHAQSPHARSTGFCVIWVCISSSSSSSGSVIADGVNAGLLKTVFGVFFKGHQTEQKVNFCEPQSFSTVLARAPLIDVSLGTVK